MKRVLPHLLACVLLCGCSGSVTSLYSNREPVFCQFNTLEYATTLNQVMGNFGEYATLRKTNSGVTKVEVTYRGSAESHTDALIQNFQFGLGGLIVGTNYMGEYRCYDWACPICDRNSRRLTLTNDGYAHCEKCGVVFDLNNEGVIYRLPDENPPSTRRGLYRYYIVFDPNSHIMTVRNAP